MLTKQRRIWAGVINYGVVSLRMGLRTKNESQTYNWADWEWTPSQALRLFVSVNGLDWTLGEKRTQPRFFIAPPAVVLIGIKVKPVSYVYLYQSLKLQIIYNLSWGMADWEILFINRVGIQMCIKCSLGTWTRLGEWKLEKDCELHAGFSSSITYTGFSWRKHDFNGIICMQLRSCPTCEIGRASCRDRV